MKKSRPGKTGPPNRVTKRLGLAIAALLALEAAALGIKAWEERQSADLMALEALQREAVALSARIDDKAGAVASAISVGQRSGTPRARVASSLDGVDVVLSLRDAAAAEEGSREKRAAEAAVDAISSGDDIAVSAGGDVVFIVEETGFPTALGLAPAQAWLPSAQADRRNTLVGAQRFGVGEARLAEQAASATLGPAQIQSGENMLRASTACAPLGGSGLHACVTQPSPLFTPGDILRLVTYGLLLAAPLLAILGLINIVSASGRARDSADREARSAKAGLDLVMSGAKAGSWIWNPATQTAEFSPMAAELLGLEADAPCHVDTLLSLISEADRRAVRASLEGAAASSYLQVSFAPEGFQGRRFVELRASANDQAPEGALTGIAMDVTEQRLSDMRLRVAEKRLRSAIEGFAGPFALWDERRRLLYWNRAYATLFGLEDIVRQGISFDTVEMAKAGAVRRIQEDGSDKTSEYVELHTGRWLKVVQRPTPGDGLMTIALDVTENRRNQNLLQEQKRKLKTLVTKLERSEGQASELAAKYAEEKQKAEHAANTKSAFLANMSHELRTPLNAINGFSQILSEELYGPLGDERYAQYAGDILTSGQHLLELINDILDMAKIEAGKMTISLAPIDPTEPTDAAVRMMRQKVEAKGISLVLDAPTDLPEISADHRAIRQMVLNLISNAMKFTDEGGRITVAVRLQDDQVRISVTDTGIGIPKDQIARLGRPFEQISETRDRNFDGTGLGLALTKSYAGMHGGRLGIASEVGRGTRVSIYLPIDGRGATESKDIMSAAE
ncbi:MAG: ATP-binding protein [Pseudomonadota bacterium]